MTGPEHDAWLKETGQYEEMVERHRKRDEEHAQRVEALRIALIPLEEDLRTAGAPSLSALSSQTKPPHVYKAIPILLAHLQRTTYPREAHVSIAGYLSFPEVKPYWDLLLQLYRDERDESAKHELANAIIAATNEGKDNTNLDQVIALIRDKRHGVCRGLLLYLLEKTKDPRGRATMEELADDPDLAEQIGVSLKILNRNALKRAERQARKNPMRH
jgi:hypothetical protein